MGGLDSWGGAQLSTTSTVLLFHTHTPPLHLGILVSPQTMSSENFGTQFCCHGSPVHTAGTLGAVLQFPTWKGSVRTML